VHIFLCLWQTQSLGRNTFTLVWLGGESLYWINDGFDHLLLLIGLELERNL
jgi:hypothetical protein